MQLSIIIPTFNESESILNTISKIKKELINKNIDFEIIVCDDDSPDKTWKIIQNISKKDSKIKLLRRYTNKGLSSAVVDGFKIAKGDIFLVLDADGQHDEKIIPKMINSIVNNDIVVGSRYIDEGDSKSFSFYRLITSKCASYMAYPLLRKNKRIKDPMSGFFAIKKELFKKIYPKINITGYKILLDILFASPQNIKIEETPYSFKKREFGKSKLGIKVTFQYLQLLLNQFIIQNKNLIKFSIVGITGTFVNLFIMYILVEYFNLFYLISSIIAIEISIINNFILNNFWTFNNRKITTTFFSRLIKFNTISLMTIILNVSIFYIFLNLNIWYIYAQLIGILFAFFLNYLINNYWVFKNEKK